MAEKRTASTAQPRDGTGQTGRILPALDPDYAPIDARTTRDLLAFARAYAQELPYFSLDDPDHPAPGAWCDFLGTIDLDEAAAYASDPERFAPEAAGPFARPHLALFLTFLELLGLIRQQTNALTRRHLEFLYRDVLQMIRKPGVPDAVHVLVDLEAGTDELALPAGTALSAGQDRRGRDLVYSTGRELITNRVAIGQISSLHVDMQVTGLAEALDRVRKSKGAEAREAFVAMLQIALGGPAPADPREEPAESQIDFEVLLHWRRRVEKARSELGLSSFDELRELARLKKRREDHDEQDWETINNYLTRSGRERDAAFRIDPSTGCDFEANVARALGKPVVHLFDGLPRVETLHDAYTALVDRPAEVKAFLEQALDPLPLDDFKAMMQTKALMDAQWSAIDRLLEAAGTRKRRALDPEALEHVSATESYQLPRGVRESQAFDEKLAMAVAEVAPRFDYSGGLDGFYTHELLAVERRFHMPAESFELILSVATRSGDLSIEESTIADWEWDRTREIVASAHRAIVYSRRRGALKRVAQGAIDAGDTTRALGDMLATVLGEPISIDGGPDKVYEALDQLERHGISADDTRYLRAVLQVQGPPPEWDHVIELLEVAQRNQEGFEGSEPEQVNWCNLYPAVDARAVPAQSALTDTGAEPRWKCFGPTGRHADEKQPPPATLGWAVGSPLLSLSEGLRTITLTLGVSGGTARPAPPGEALTAAIHHLQVRLSEDGGWLEPETVTIGWADAAEDADTGTPDGDSSKPRSLVVTITLSQSQPALAPPTRAAHGVESSTPVLRLMPNPVWHPQEGRHVLEAYPILRKLLLVNARLEVSVTGLTDIRIGNDESTLDPKKPFEPFGGQPAVGSRFYFGHREIVGTTLDSLTLNIEWMGLPSKDLGDYYRGYTASQQAGGDEQTNDDGSNPSKLEAPLRNASFEAEMALVDGNVRRAFPETLLLFHPSDAGKPVEAKLAAPADQADPARAKLMPDDVADWPRHFEWTLLAPDFQHSAYPAKALEKSLEMAAAMTDAVANSRTPPPAANYQVNPPYTPRIKRLSLDYVASAEGLPGSEVTGASAIRVFHIHPFGYSEPEEDHPQAGGHPLLPSYDLEGELYIGLANVAAPQNVSLLFQVAEGSANPDAESPGVRWSYLSGNHWIPLDEDGRLSDGTRGLVNSGIVHLSLAPAAPSTLLPEALYWIRAAIARSSDGVCDMVAIHPNAVLATFVDDDNVPDHLGQPLAPGRVTAPVIPVPGIAGLRQPYTSFGGKMAERDASFNMRVSERLRHKQRALTVWDYEHLVLERFPEIYKAKCLRANPAAHPHDPGRLELVVIPDIRNRRLFDPFAPKAPADLLRDIGGYLRDKMPPFARIEVKNAHYVPVKVRCAVSFYPGQDEGACRRRLTEDLHRLLSPWAHADGADLVLGGSMYANSIIEFLDSREYVDYVAHFKLFADQSGGVNFEAVPEPTTAAEGYRAAAERPDGVLVAAREHTFEVISTTGYRLEDFIGIEHMKIELDFKVV